MRLNYVTLTGADDNTSPKDMVALSAKYPYVEWGILFSQSKSGVPRYPSLRWVKSFVAEVINAKHPVNVSIHLCGKWVDDIIGGHFSFIPFSKGIVVADKSLYEVLNRIQLNMYKSRLWQCFNSQAFMQIVLDFDGPSLIIGGNYNLINLSGEFFAKNYLQPLFDCSGGKGILTEWRKPFLAGDKTIFCGYAGGLGPDNVEEQLIKIKEVVSDDNASIWIDMETKLRVEDQFNLAICEDVLVKMEPWCRL